MQCLFQSFHTHADVRVHVAVLTGGGQPQELLRRPALGVCACVCLLHMGWALLIQKVSQTEAHAFFLLGVTQVQELIKPPEKRKQSTAKSRLKLPTGLLSLSSCKDTSWIPRNDFVQAANPELLQCMSVPACSHWYQGKRR